MTNEIINRLLRAGFIVRLQADRSDHFGADVFNQDGDTVAFASCKTLDEAIDACLIHVIEFQAEQIRGMQAAIDVAPESVKRFLRPIG